MNNQKKWMLGIIVVLVLVNITTLASFWMMRKPNHPPQMEKFFEKELNFTAEQTTAFKELKDTHRTKVRQLRDSIKFYREGLFEEMLSDNPNQANLNRINLKIGEIQIAMDRGLVQHYSEVKEICTSVEQKDKLKAVFKKMIKRQPPPPRKEK